MKSILISIVLVIGFANFSTGQSNLYGLSVGVGNGFILRQKSLGGGSYDLNTGLSIGFQYEKGLNNKLHLITGVNWYNNSVSVTPAFYPGIEMTPKKHDIQLLYIPVFLKLSLSKYFFLNGGLIGDLDITKNKYITNQSGMGTGLGIGTAFSINEKLLIQINPYINLHGLILTASENYPERIFDSGIKLSLMIKK